MKWQDEYMMNFNKWHLEAVAWNVTKSVRFVQGCVHCVFHERKEKRKTNYECNKWFYLVFYGKVDIDIL